MKIGLFLMRIVVLNGILFSYAIVWAQSQPNDAPNTIRATTHLVNVSVVVTDKTGQTITNLQKKDFQLIDGGKTQAVAFFTSSTNAYESTPESLRSPDTFANASASGSRSSNVTILLLDDLNSHWAAQGYSLHRLCAFLRQVQPQDHVGIYVLSDDLHVVHDYTRDAADIVAAIRRYDEGHRDGTSPAAANIDQENLDRLLTGGYIRYRAGLEGSKSGGMAGSYVQAQMNQAADETLAALQEIARQLSFLSGRKSLVWLTERVPRALLVDDSDEFLAAWRGSSGAPVKSSPKYEFGLEVERMIHLMNDSGIAVYPVDVRGLESLDLDFRNHPNASPILDPEDPVQDVIARTPQVNSDLLELASRTGGRAFYNRNDIETGVRQALDDSRFTYNLSYYPDHGKWKGEWRKIQVKVNRPDAKVLARGGYFAMADPRPMPPKILNDFIAEIAASPIESSQLPLTVHLDTEAGPQRLNARVHFSPRFVLTNQQSGDWKGNLELLFFQLGEKNKIMDVTTQTADIDLKPSSNQELLGKGVDMQANIDLKAGTTMLCVILYDKNSGQAGSVRIANPREIAQR